jgi:hypothetical protein
MGDGVKLSLDVSFDNMRGWQRIQEEAGEVNSMEAYKKIMRFPIEFATEVSFL